jgi:hypothetical protein
MARPPLDVIVYPRTFNRPFNAAMAEKRLAFISFASAFSLDSKMQKSRARAEGTPDQRPGTPTPVEREIRKRRAFILRVNRLPKP